MDSIRWSLHIHNLVEGGVLHVEGHSSQNSVQHQHLQASGSMAVVVAVDAANSRTEQGVVNSQNDGDDQAFREPEQKMGQELVDGFLTSRLAVGTCLTMGQSAALLRNALERMVWVGWGMASNADDLEALRDYYMKWIFAAQVPMTYPPSDLLLDAKLASLAEEGSLSSA